MARNTRDRFAGDPALILTADGLEIDIRGGQPVMDTGFENAVMISLLTARGWAGNAVLDERRQIGSRFPERVTGYITLSRLNDARQSAERALDLREFGDVDVDITNPNGSQVQAVICITPPGDDVRELRLDRFGELWRKQATEPAHRRLVRG